jgi:hypothetical protein
MRAKSTLLVRRHASPEAPGAASCTGWAPPYVVLIVIFDGNQWVSSDGKWLWDGSRWRSTSPRFTVGRLPEASVEAWIYRIVLAIQGSGVGCAGLMLAMIAFFATLGGALLTALAVFGAAAVGILIAAGFGLLALKQRRVRDRWRIALLPLQVALFAIAIPLLNAANYVSDHAGTPQNPGTDGPFADGGYGLAALTSWAFIGGAEVVVAVLLWEQIVVGVRWLKARRNAITIS